MKTQRKAKCAEPILTPEELERIKTAFALKGLLTARQTAYWLGVRVGSLSVWRCMKRYEHLGLIATYSGGKPMYRVEDVLKFQASGRGRRQKPQRAQLRNAKGGTR